MKTLYTFSQSSLLDCEMSFLRYEIENRLRAVYLFPFYFNVCFMNCDYHLKRGVDEGPLLTPFPPQLLRENGCLPKTDCSRYIL